MSDTLNRRNQAMHESIRVACPIHKAGTCRDGLDAADAAVNLGAAANVLRVYRSDKEMGSARLTELIVDAALGRQSNE